MVCGFIMAAIYINTTDANTSISYSSIDCLPPIPLQGCRGCRCQSALSTTEGKEIINSIYKTDQYNEILIVLIAPIPSTYC